MKLVTAVVWTIAIVIWAFVIWPPAGKVMLFLLVFTGDAWTWLVIELHQRDRARRRALRV
jgi:hypothetical protein